MIVHLVTDRRRLCEGANWDESRRCLLRQAGEAVAAGVDVIQLRERDVEARHLAALAAEMVALTRGSRTRVVVNDRVDVAIAAGAHGVHLRGDSIPASHVRRMAPPGFLVGCSVHTVEDARAATAADYVIAGTVWASRSKSASRDLLGVEGLAGIARAVDVPVLAIGGVTVDNARAAAESGAQGIAGIGLFVDARSSGPRGARELEAIVQILRERFDTSRSHS